jgi:glycosyltransferase involved in cell wall biosynthesis
LRVAFVTVGDTSRLTGGYLYHARLFEGLRERGVEIKEVVPCGASPAEQKAAASRLGTMLGPSYFDVVVVDALARIVCAPWLDRWRAVRPVVAMVHELPSLAAGREADPDRGLEEPLFRADRLIAVSDHGRSILCSRSVPAGQMRVVPPGFDRLAPVEPEEQASLRGEEVRALCVAQWIPRKGILELVEAWKMREGLGATLELVGETDADPAYTASVQHAVASDPSIIISGPVADATLIAAYAAADLFVLPSRYEGYGIVYAEALAFGLPVIACDAGPVPELVGRDAALLVPPDDVGALAGALDLLLEDPALRSRLASAARRRAKELPRWDDTVTGFLRVLQEAIAERSR